jgi:serine/threonine-protein kinase HipA
MNTCDKLFVELYGNVIGHIIPNQRGFVFQSTETGIDQFKIGSTILGIAVPLLPNIPNRSQAKYQNYFEELIPEGINREILERYLPITKRSTYEILRRFGRDIAGAIQIYDNENRIVSEPFMKPVNDAEIKELLLRTTALPFANDINIGKTSLAGVQQKIVLGRTNNVWNQVLNGYPSTHILKPQLDSYPTMIYDELFGMQLASQLGLTTVETQISTFNGLDALVISRYDRKIASDATIERIHQEDFNQVLVASGNQKYQEISGKVSFNRIGKIVEKFVVDDLETLAKYALFAYIIGDLDMHAKNISLLHYPDQTVRLAPKYDAVPLLHQNTDRKLSLSVGGEYHYDNITVDHFVNEFKALGIPKSRTIQLVNQLTTKTLSSIMTTKTLSPHPKASPALIENVLAACKVLQKPAC